MDLQLTQSDMVYSKDGEKLGNPHCIRRRLDPSEADPDLQLYEAYVHVVSFDMGEDFFIPSDFFAERNPTDRRVTLALPFKKIERGNWMRMPDFVARGQAEKELLPHE